ncbi:MAG: MBL fold metallo-hydrolase RNA specificity domain-containing protein [Bacillota bacterium]
MKLHFLGAARTVTGSCYLIETGATRFLVDCGMFQGSKEIRERNYGEFAFNPGSIDFLLLTHAHIDHSGLIPKLYKHGFKGPTIATTATVDLCRIMLPDSGHIQEMECDQKNRKYSRSGHPLINPIYTALEAEHCIQYFRGVAYRQETILSPDVRIRYQDAGHILGSGILEIWITEGAKETKLVFSGDLGNYNQPIVNDPTDIDAADYLIIESTYGSRLHEEQENKLDRLSKIIRESFARGGNVIIPAFAVERTQELLLNLNVLIQRGELSSRDVYVDSPLAISATEIFCQYPEYYDQETLEMRYNLGGQCPLYLPGLKYSRTKEDSMALNQIKKGAIIISASGMCDAGRIKHHLKHNLWRLESTVLFVGYQAQGTLGQRILSGEKAVRIHGEEVAVRARIEKIEGFSAHADQAALLKWVGKIRQKPSTVFVTHGEETAAVTLAGLINEQAGIEAVAPNWLDVVDLPVGSRLPAEALVMEKLELKPTGTDSNREVEQVYMQLQNKLRSFVDAKINSEHYEEALKVMKNADKLLESLLQTGRG